MRTKQMLPVAVALLISTLLAAVPADADSLGRAGPVRYVVEAVTIPAASSTPTEEDAEVSCPSGWTSISGGASIKSGNQRALTWTSKSGVRSWFARAWQQESTATTLRAYAVCLQSSATTVKTVGVHEVPPGQVVQTSYCDSGSVVGGGGRPIGEASDWQLNTSHPMDGDDADSRPDDGWRTYYNYTGSESSLLVDAICLEGTPPSYHSKTAALPALSTKTVKAACPATKHVLGGGAYVNGEVASARVVATRPFDSGDAGAVPDDGWLVTYRNTSASALETTAHAFCR